MNRRNFINAEVTACALTQHAAQLVNAIVDAKHTSTTGRGGDVYMETVAEEIAEIRRQLTNIEATIGIDTQAEAA